MDLSGPCNWPVSACPDCGDDCGSLTGTQRAEYEAWAISDLWQATGKVYGTCTVTVMPCNDWGVLCGSCWNTYRSCGCVNVSEVKLPGPVASVTEVIVDGEVIPDTDYRIDDYQWLVRLDGLSWPSNTDYLDPDAFSVTYETGIAPPAGAGIVTGILMCSRSSCSVSGCVLPRGTTQVSRQGVTMIRGNLGGQTSSRPWRYETNTMEIFGIPAVDQWIRNAQYPTRAGAVHSPDLPHVRQITWAAPTSP